jgi:hypothetical protein
MAISNQLKIKHCSLPVAIHKKALTQKQKEKHGVKSNLPPSGQDTQVCL